MLLEADVEQKPQKNPLPTIHQMQSTSRTFVPRSDHMDRPDESHHFGLVRETRSSHPSSLSVVARFSVLALLPAPPVGTGVKTAPDRADGAGVGVNTIAGVTSTLLQRETGKEGNEPGTMRARRIEGTKYQRQEAPRDSKRREHTVRHSGGSTSLALLLSLPT